jgi:hypothetical protein
MTDEDEFVDLLLEVTIASHDVGAISEGRDDGITLQDAIEIEVLAIKRLIAFHIAELEKSNANGPGCRQ